MPIRSTNPDDRYVVQSISLPPAMREQIKQAANNQGITLSKLIQEIIAAYLATN